MRYTAYILAGIILCMMCSCNVKKIEDIERAAPASFERIEVGEPLKCYARLDFDENGVWVCTIEADHGRKSGGGPIPIRDWETSLKVELRFKPNLSGTYRRWEDDEVIQEKLFTAGFFHVFGIFDESGQPRASLEAGDDFAQVLFFDGSGQLRIKFHIDDLENEWQEATVEVLFYDEDGQIIQL